MPRSHIMPKANSKLRITFILNTLVLLITFSIEKVSSQEVADTVYTNGNVYTVDVNRSWAEAFGVKDGRFVFVGNSVEARNYIGSATQVIDLNGAFVSPGFHDLHIHALLGELSGIYDCNFDPSLSVDDILQIVAECGEKYPDNIWIQGGAWFPNLMDDYEGRPIRELLDEVSGDKAVYLRDFSGTNAMVNSRALELAGYNEDTEFEKPEYARKDPVTGELNGFLSDTAAYEIFNNLPLPAFDDQVTVLGNLVKRLHSFGLMGWKESFADENLLRVYTQVDSAGDLNAYVGVASRIEAESDIDDLLDWRRQYRAGHINANFAKIMLDGVPPTKSAFMLAPYEPDDIYGSDWHGEPSMGVDQFSALMEQLDKEGFIIKVHASGDASVRMTLDAVESLRNKNGASGNLHEVAHAMYIDPADLPRFNQLNVAAELSPMLWQPSNMVHMMITLALGEAGLKMFPVKDLLRTGAHVVPGTDWPVGSSTDPLLGFEAMVTRNNPESGILYRQMDRRWGALWPEQRVSVAEAVDIYTINSARSLDMDDVTGSIESGKSADFVVWDKNFFEIDPSDISETKVLKTVFEGRVVYEF